MIRTALIMLLAALALGFLGCDSDDGGASPCEEAMSKMCQMACDCVEGDGCAVGGQGGALTFETEDDCVGFYVTLGCMNGGSDKIDFPACTEALSGALCVDSGENKALSLPEACNEPPEGE